MCKTFYTVLSCEPMYIVHKLPSFSILHVETLYETYY